MKKIPLVFFGSSHYVIPIITKLQKNFDIRLVVTTEVNVDQPVPAFCEKNLIPYLSISQFDLQTEEIIRNTQSLIGVVVDFGLIIPEFILDIFPNGILNIHPSLLPKYRGPTPVQTALLNGDTVTGVTIIKLDKEMDHGPIVGEITEAIESDDTADSLYQELFEEGAEMLVQKIPQYINGELELRDQDHSKATFTKQRLTKQDGYIQLTEVPDNLQNMIRAYHPWPGIWTKMRIKNNELRIKLLPERKLQVEGKKPVSIKDFLNGYPELKEDIEKLFPL